MSKQIVITPEQYDSIVDALAQADDLATGVIRGENSLHVRALDVARVINIVKKCGISLPKTKR